VLIILTLWILLAWLVFAKLKLLKWGWISGTFVALGGAFIHMAFPAGYPLNF
jgi:hypothetical protein